MTKIDFNISGVYRIKCKVNGRQYFGQSGSVIVRIATHIMSLNRGKHVNRDLQRDWAEFGAAGFVIELVDRIDSSHERCKLESSLIVKHARRHKLYNNTVIKRARKIKSKKKNRKIKITVSPLRVKRYKTIPMRIVDRFTNDELSNLLNLSEAAKEKGMPTKLFKYYVLKKDAPVAVGIGRPPKPYWYRSDIHQWNLRQDSLATIRRNTRKGLAAGK